ncbi:MAG: hypothetical protein AB7V46_07825 [Thermomicrobiales bacterium]
MTETNNGEREMMIEHNPRLAERLRKFQEDYLWILTQVTLREQYKNQVVILHDRRVIGSGRTDVEAKADARQQAASRAETLPPDDETTIVLVPAMAWIEVPNPSAQAAIATENS